VAARECRSPPGPGRVDGFSGFPGPVDRAGRWDYDKGLPCISGAVGSPWDSVPSRAASVFREASASDDFWQSRSWEAGGPFAGEHCVSSVFVPFGCERPANEGVQ